MTAKPWSATAGGVTLHVRLTPKGGRDAIDGVETLSDGRSVLKCRVRAAPTEGEANEALCRLLAKTLSLAPRDVTVAAGATARIKRIMLSGDGEYLMGRLEAVCATL